jgi:hypothetical protein
METIQMSTLPILGKALPLTALIAASVFTVVAVDVGQAQQRNNNNSGQIIAKPPHRGPAIGGTSWTLSDVWGEPKMPPPPVDFGPGFDFAPGGYNLNGAPNNSPYPN